MKKHIPALALFIAFIVLLAACGPIKPGEETTGPSRPPETSENTSPDPTEKPDPKSEYWDVPVFETRNPEDLDNYLELALSKNPGMFGLRLEDLTTGVVIGVRDSEQYPAGDFACAAVNLYLYNEYEMGNANPDDTVILKEGDILSTDGKMDGYGASDEITLSDLSRISLEKCDKTAANVLAGYLGRGDINEYLKGLGTKNTEAPLYSSPEDSVMIFKEINRLAAQKPEIYSDLLTYMERNDGDFTMEPPGKDIEIYGTEGSARQLLASSHASINKGYREYILAIYSESSDIQTALETTSEAAKAIYGFFEYGILPVFETKATDMIYDNIVEDVRPKNIGYFEEVLVNGIAVRAYFDDSDIDFPERGGYASEVGLATFRGDNFRSGGAYGFADITEEKLEIVWDFNIGSISTQSGGYWPGVGWTGQPAIVRWDGETSANMNVKDKFKGTELREVIYGSLDGNIYFCELETGEWTRDPIRIGYPTKGSVSVDPRGYPLLFTGQGIGENGTETLTPRFRIFDLTDQSLLFEINGDDPDSFREWPNFDSSGLLDVVNDTYYQMGENGIIYKIKLNTSYDPEKGGVSISPEVVKYRYLNPFGPNIGIESSPAVYGHYLYCTDNNGMVACIDVNNLKALWVAGTGDDTDSTPVLDETPTGIFLYTGTEVDIQGAAGGSPDGRYPAALSKFNALTGELIWRKEYDCLYNSVINGGVLGTPVVGRGNIADLVIYPLAKYGGEYMGRLVALDKATGEEVWSIDSESYSWSSPTAVYTPEGKAYILYCNFAGNMYLIEGDTGKILDIASLGANVEGSPGVYGNTAVIGSYAKKIFGVKIK